jgi:hypothetical protein
MKDCPQTEGQSTLEHGFSVKNHLFDLLNHLRNGTPLKYEWKIPHWVYDNKDLILKSLPSDKTLKLATIFHDCGKWKCLVIDPSGKRHFPYHADESYQIFSSLFDDAIAGDLIKHDMDIHVLKSSDIEDFCKNPHSLTSLIIGLCEINSNAKMFGSLQSDSFKIKYKSILKKGKKIIEYHEKNRT